MVPRLVPEILSLDAFCDGAAGAGIGDSRSWMCKMFKSRTSTLKYLRSVKDCSVVLCILHCRVVLDLLKSVEKQKIPKLVIAPPVPGPLFTGEVGNKVVDSVLNSLLSSTIA